MTTKLPDEVRRAVAEKAGGPVYVDDSEAHTTYVVLSAVQFEHLRVAGEAEESSLVDSYPLQETVARAAGWDDPLMDDYDHYDAHRG
jgi:hypothetical protein